MHTQHSPGGPGRSSSAPLPSRAEPTTDFTPVAISQWSGFPLERAEDESDSVFTSGEEIPSWHHAEDGEDASMWMDGAQYRRAKPGVSAIFIHAGAGYHSTANERMHLDACSEAARCAMKVLRDGHSAVDAVEVAIRVLEDKEITNAGYGSNLSIDGTVECDATIVDHLGRSGACGAVPNIKNPISLAKLILERSSHQLSLRRVPPNLLIGDGAKEFAWQQGMSLIPNDWLISRNARDRFTRWQEDLKRAEEKEREFTPSTPTKPPISEYVDEARHKAHRDHTTAILTGTWNEGQPDSPSHPATPAENGPLPSPSSQLKPQSPISNGPTSPRPSPPVAHERSPLNFLGSMNPADKSGSSKSGSPARKRQRFLDRQKAGSPRGSDVGDPDEMDTGDGAQSPAIRDSRNTDSPVVPHAWTDGSSKNAKKKTEDFKEDLITDTVGAIAIDQYGLIAAGSSSGGIGMKHRGRVGPAALVGIGTAIIPADEHDSNGITIGAVTSGTGEHMATTMASQKCAERLYHGTVRAEGGFDMKENDESAILEGFIIRDFELHPGVLNSSSASAIGVMAVKKAPRGYYLYFAHNTDSFALTSMASTDRNPHCVMSRLNEGKGKKIAQGARKIPVG